MPARGIYESRWKWLPGAFLKGKLQPTFLFVVSDSCGKITVLEKYLMMYPRSLKRVLSTKSLAPLFSQL